MNIAVVDEKALTCADFRFIRTCDTRWGDNDMFGHLNNAVYYQLFDSVINSWAIKSTGFDPMRSGSIPVVAESGCKFFREVAFPNRLAVGLRVEHLGMSSVVYQLGLFSGADEVQRVSPIAALGRWVHVYLDRATRRPSRVPEAIRALIVETL